MSNYPLRANKYNWRSLTPETNYYYTDEYTASMYDMYSPMSLSATNRTTSIATTGFMPSSRTALRWRLLMISNARAAKAMTSSRSADARIFIRWACTNARCATEIREEHGNDHIQ